MNFFQAYFSVRLLLGCFGLGVVVIAAYFVIAHGVMESWTAEKTYQQAYGDTWREHYLAERHISVEDDHRKAIFGVAGMITMGVLCYLIYRQIVPRGTSYKRSRRRRRSSSMPA